MALTMEIQAVDLDTQIKVLQAFPDIADKNFRPAMQEAVGMLDALVIPAIPTLTGRARSLFATKITGRGLNLTGAVGWWDGSAWYINIVEYGARAHDIFPRDKKALHFGSEFALVVHHPGFAARRFMADALQMAGSAIDTAMSAASEGVVNDLQVNSGDAGGGEE
jgi:hypothetical protein